MNRRGHVETLVAAHPGNTNAVKSGVYARDVLVPRILELDEAMAARPAAEVEVDLLRRELASLTALAEAMDASLATQGILGRGGSPRAMVAQRVRVHDKLRRCAAALREITEGQAADDSVVEATADGNGVRDLLGEIARRHLLNSPADLTPRSFNPDAFLAAIIVTPDPAVTAAVRLRARQLLTKRETSRPLTCLCPPTRDAHDEIEFRRWMENARASGVSREEWDETLAAFVRRLARGEKVEPWAHHRRLHVAFDEVLTLERRRARGDVTDSNKLPPTRETDPTVQPFWLMLLGAQRSTSPALRLKAFVALDQLGVLPHCTCTPSTARLIEEKNDEADAHTIQLLVRRHSRAAIERVRYPQTYVALQEALGEVIPEVAGA